MGSYKKVGYTGPLPGEGGPGQPLRYLCRNLQEEENQRLAHKLHERVRLLRSLSIEIGAEVRYQNRYLGSLDDDLDRTDGVLHKALARVSQLSRNPQFYYFVYIALFTLACLATVWCVVRFR
ncbi:BET1 homolog [Frankliniella occidentalis]|uniref:BET1 homolog n=1 Tax=Frankliniella occidentalis TaxID=133901 RepID=A0A6J1SE05_FRAOC|nr:BET1 homolog [Frankliniella occidentalis]